MSSSTVLRDNWQGLALAATVFYLSYHIMKFIGHRRFYKDLPTPPHSLILGNLKVMGEATKRYPADAHPQALFTNLGLEYDLRGLYYMDLSPFADPMIIITDPEVAHQVQHSPQFGPHPFTKKFLGDLIGTKSLFAAQGVEWSKQKSWFAPAFSMASVVALVPGMVKQVLIFREKMERFAESGEVFCMNDMAMALAIDIIGQSVGDIELGSQTGGGELLETYFRATEWTAGITEPLWMKILGPWVLWWYCRKLDRLLGKVIRQKFGGEKGVKGGEGGIGQKTILNLAWKGYVKENGMDQNTARADLDETFMKVALDNAKVFFIAGHDTTASLITYSFHYLSLHPSILARVRAEHDTVFGPTFDDTVSTLSSSPHLLNSLPLTSAVQKEVLRLHSAGFTIKAAAAPGASVTYKGKTYPTAGHMIAVVASAMGRNDSYWTNPHAFDPDRWLPSDSSSPSSSSSDPKGEKTSQDPGLTNNAYQPFERGPRACIGQQLALVEARLILVLVARWYDFETVFGPVRGAGKEDEIEGWGGRAYQVVKMTAKPKDGLPMRVKKRKSGK